MELEIQLLVFKITFSWILIDVGFAKPIKYDPSFKFMLIHNIVLVKCGDQS